MAIMARRAVGDEARLRRWTEELSGEQKVGVAWVKARMVDELKELHGQGVPEEELKERTRSSQTMR